MSGSNFVLPSDMERHILNRTICSSHSSYPSKNLNLYFAEREGFEPPEVLPSTVFKTAAIDHSAISPLAWFSLQSYIFFF